MSSGDSYADDILNVWRNTAFSAKDGGWVSLHTGDPGNTGASEVSTSGTAYGRLAVTASEFDAPNGATGSRIIDTNAVQSFAEATGAGFGTVTHLGFWSAETSGDFEVGGALDSSQAVAAGVTASFAAGDLKIGQT